MRNIIIMAMMLSLLMWSCQGSGEKSSEQEEVTVYTHRHYSSDQDLFRAFQDETGIRVNVVNASADELIQKMIMEGEQSPRSEEHTSELQSRGQLVCRLLLEKKKISHEL